MKVPTSPLSDRVSKTGYRARLPDARGHIAYGDTENAT